MMRKLCGGKSLPQNLGWMGQAGSHLDPCFRIANVFGKQLRMAKRIFEVILNGRWDEKRGLDSGKTTGWKRICSKIDFLRFMLLQ